MSQPQAPLPHDQLLLVAALFKTLGDPTRLRILQALCLGPKSVNEIVADSEASQTNVSKHLRLLVHAGVLSSRREGQRIFYALRSPLVLELCRLVHNALHNAPSLQPLSTPLSTPL